MSPCPPEHAERLDDFFRLIEQAFARVVGWHDGGWSLPGARRVRARLWEAPCISLEDSGWHLLGSQKANGLWGLYRGASRRAGLLTNDMTRLSDETMKEATLNAGVEGRARKRLLEAVQEAMDDVALHLGERGLDLEEGAADRRGGVHGRMQRAEGNLPARAPA